MQQIAEGFRSSPQQSRLWLTQQQSHTYQRNAYQARASVSIEGQLDITRFQHALETVLMRHEIYRTYLHQVVGLSVPIQVINTTPLSLCRYIDLTVTAVEDRKKDSEYLLGEENTLIIDVEHGPVIYSTMLILSACQYIWSIHLSAFHADPQTLHNLVEEVTRSYHASTEQADEVIQYAQFSEWQHELLQENSEEERAYWSTKDFSAFSTVALPFMTKQQEPRPFAPDLFAVPLVIREDAQLEALLEKLRCTFPGFLLTCWSILLWKLTGSNEVPLGLSVDGRIEDLRETAGSLAKCLPLVCSFNRQQTGRELLIQIQQAYDELLPHHPYFHWDQLEGAIGSVSFSPSFGFEWREQSELLATESVSFLLQHWESYSEPFHVKLVALQGSMGLTIQFHFDRNRFEIQQIQRIAAQFSLVVEQLVAQPEQDLETLNILSEAEQQELLLLAHGQAIDYPSHLCLHQLFEQQVARTPDAIAVEQGKEVLTYQQLNGRANQLARYLQQLGVGPEVLVGLALEPSITLIVGIFGILKAGGAYIPLDITSPKPRLASTVERAHLSVLVTQSSVQASLPTIEHTICLDTEWAAITQWSADNWATCPAHPSNLAYVLYTSGSTGEPKGVMIPHQGVVHYVDWSSKYYEVARGFGSPVHSPLSFDLTVTSVFPPLVVGSRLVLVPSGPGIEFLGETLLQQQFSLLKITPAHLALLVQSLQPEAFATVAHTLVIGGEALHSDSVKMWRQHAPATRVINEYGPTETVVGCSIHEVVEDEELSGVVPIGRPIPNMQLYLLDAHLRPVPLGVAGELYIGGVGVGRGYLNQADLTAERFLANPLSEEPGMRLYKTGDVARYISADGTLEYVGRTDRQVKLRGYRIELDEIEKVLRRYPQIRDCVVLLQEEERTASRLIGYVVARKESGLTPEAVQGMLRKDLPEYMVPSVFVLLDGLPLTRNGKVDRRQLPQPEQVQRRDRGTWTATPRSPLEDALLTMWRDLLARPTLGIHDNFFAVGGHSLLATRLIAQVRTMFQREILVKAVFEAPTVAEFAQQVERALRTEEMSPIPPLMAKARPEVLPLSYAQQRLWFLEQLEPESSAYLIPQALSMRGKVDAQRLEEAFTAMVHRHESLRTTFEEHVGRTRQVIHPAEPYTMPIIDLQRLEREQREQEARYLSSQEAQRPCNLVKGPLLRTMLLRVEQETHVLLLTLHHIITDGWSSGVFVHELTTLYRALVAGLPASLATLAIQYADYALWQRGWLQGAVLDDHLVYWRARLAALPVLELPTDHPRPAMQTFRGAIQFFQLSTALSEGLVKLSQQEHVTLFMTLLAAFQVLVQRYSGQDDFAVGTPIANRGHAEIESVIGFFINTLVLRSELGGTPTFTELLHRVRETCLGAYAHQDVPFEQVVEVLAPTRDLSRSPLFQVMLTLQNTLQEQEDVAGIRVEPVVLESTISKFDLTLSLSETHHGLIGTLEYNTDLFESQTITRFLDHWQTLLDSIVHNPQSLLWNLPLLTAEEHEQMLVHWHATAMSCPQDYCVHQLFEAQVERTPDAVALVFEAQALTYRQLNRCANQLAHYLQTLDLGLDELVGVFMERSIDLLIGVLGVLKAGGAYLPLDVSSPTNRLSALLQEGNPKVILTQTSLLKSVPNSEIPNVCLDIADAIWKGAATHNPSTRIFPENAAYVISTSGSTGKPKGVITTHRGLHNNLLWRQAEYPLTSQDILLQKTPYIFDASCGELFWPLIAGARLVIARPEGHRNSQYLASLLYQEDITVLDVVPSQLQMLLEEPAWSSNVMLRQVLCGGEALSIALQHRFFACSTATLYNAYGPTEATIDASSWLCREEEDAFVPIGSPIANVQMYVLDVSLQLVPMGVPGELYISGEGLARGYRQEPALTAASFLPHPWSLEPGARLYRTGDLVRMRRGGKIEYMRRIDQQVKIRGHRIELGEIEAVLQAHPQVQNAAVLAREDMPGDKRLVAYVVLQPGETLPTHALRTFLQDRLPAYMLPATFMVLDTLPLTSNGKIDRRALPAPEGSRPDLTESFVGPQSLLQRTLTAIWSEVLRVDPIGIHDNFFSLGGDSILSLQVIARARQAGLHLSVKQLFQYQSIAALSSVTTTAEPSHTEHALVTGPVRLTPIQHWFFARHLPTPSHFNQAIALHTPQPVQRRWLEQALQHLVLHHDALRLRFLSSPQGWLQEIAGPPVQPVVRFVDLSALSDDAHLAAMTRLADAAQTSLDLSAGLLLQALCIHRGSAHPDLLLLIIHHLAVDGVSWRILAADLEVAYRQRSQQQPIVLPDKTTSWQHWAEQLWHYAQSEAVHSQQRFWVTARDLPLLPIEKAEGLNTIANSATVHVSLSREYTQALLHDVPAAYHTRINEVLLTALVLAFAPWTGQPRLLVDLEGHGREDVIEGVDLSRTVGWFTTVFPVLLDIEQASTPADALKRVKESVRQIPHHGLGYGLLRVLSQDAAGVDSLSTQQQAQVIFNYLGQFDATLPETSLFSFANAPTGLPYSLLEPRSHLLEINSNVSGGQLHLSWQYSRAIHHQQTIEAMAQRFLTALTELIIHCQSPQAGGYTPSDFPLAGLDQPQLDALIQSFPRDQESRPGELIEDLYPLSPMQAGLLFHSLYEPDTGIYCGQMGWTIEGTFETSAWQRAWQVVIERHAILRTCFVWQGLPQAMQVVLRHIELPWTVHDWRSLSPHEQQRRLEAVPQEHELKRVDLEHAPLLRLILVRLAADTVYFHLSIHHLISDGWSQQRLLQEVQEAYVAFARGQVPTFAPTRPYRDYIAWVQQQETQQAEHFWRTYLRGLTTPTPLPGAEAPTSSRSHAALHRQVCSEAFSASVHERAQQLQVTLNTVVQGAWALLLSRYSGERDVVFGATTTGRPADLASVETMMGVFINTLPVRIRIPNEMAVSDWLRQVQAEQVDARQYEYTPLVQIQAWSSLPHGHPLFESLLVFQNYPIAPSVLGASTGMRSRRTATVEQTHYPLMIKAIPTPAALILELQYDDARFEAAVITRLLHHLEVLLGEIVEHPQQRLETLSLLTHEEEHRLLVEWNRTGVPLPVSSSLQQPIEQQVERTPDAVALVFEDEFLTYADLNRRANQLAHHLQRLGIGPERLVGVCMPRSIEMVLALLAILKAGGAYVPLDPTYPHERLAFMLADAEVTLLLTCSLPEALHLGTQRIQTMDLVSAWEVIATQNPENLHNRIFPENLAYVIYTSGSTGRPKGTMIQHGNVANFFTAMDHLLGDDQPGRWLALTSMSFDISVLELLWTLTRGFQVGVRASHQEMGRLGTDEPLGAQIQRLGITHLQCTPSQASLFLGDPEMLMALDSLQHLFLGGEALPLALLKQIEQQVRGAIHNMYGPTETTIWSLTQQMQQGASRVVIGRPIANTQVYLLDPYGHSVPVGVIGELCIGGDGVARGYLNRADATAEKFLPDPYNREAGAVLYRTGDLARYLSDGTIECLGRVDQQIKLRGYRIELGEIESLLHDHPGVSEAVVQVYEEVVGDKEIVAYVVLHEEHSTTDHDLQAYLQARVPEYMLPSSVVMLDALPLTPNGKIDRRALPKPGRVRPKQAGTFVPPRTPAEEVVAAIWAQVLHVEQVGSTDNFFELGGHSLRAVQVISRLRDAFQVEMSLQSLFEHPTIEWVVSEMALLGGGSEIIEETAMVLQELEHLSDAEIQTLLDAEEQEGDA